MTNSSIECSITKYKRVLTNQLSSIPVSFNINLCNHTVSLSHSPFLSHKRTFPSLIYSRLGSFAVLTNEFFILDVVVVEKIGTLTILHMKLYCSFKIYPYEENYSVHQQAGKAQCNVFNVHLKLISKMLAYNFMNKNSKHQILYL